MAKSPQSNDTSIATLATAAAAKATERLEAAGDVPPGTFVNVSIRSNDLRILSDAVPESADEATRELATTFINSVAGMHHETEVAVSAASILQICAAITS